jgi:hypothetical protein
VETREYVLKDGRQVREDDENKIVKVNCEYCTEIAWRPFKTKKHRFCSYSCASKHRQHLLGNIPVYDDSPCVICGTSRRKRIFQSTLITSRSVCSKRCAGKLSATSRGRELDIRTSKIVDGKKYVFLIACERCKSPGWTRHNGKEQRYCSRECAAQQHSEEGSGFASNEKKIEYWTKVHGLSEAQIRLAKMREKQSIGVSASNCRRHLSIETSTRIAASVRAAYADGRLKPPGFRYSRHAAHGYNFRSRLELCYANELVEADLVPGIDWEYEPEDLKVFWCDDLNVEHTHYPDFRVLGDIVEVKPKSRLKDVSVLAKAEAARLIATDLGVEYYFVTERDVQSYRRRAS